MKNPPGISYDATGGLWYYVWLKPNWVFMGTKQEYAQHPAIWAEEILPAIGEHYQLSDGAFEKLFLLFRAMPRGRVMSVNYGQRFRIAHGSDFPSSIGMTQGILQVKHHFGLGRRCVETEQQEHETMDREHQRTIQKIIGKVPY